jgi:hypothetical protein
MIPEKRLTPPPHKATCEGEVKSLTGMEGKRLTYRRTDELPA